MGVPAQTLTANRWFASFLSTWGLLSQLSDAICLRWVSVSLLSLLLAALSHNLARGALLPKVAALCQDSCLTWHGNLLYFQIAKWS